MIPAGVLASFAGRRVLVTGGTGLIGRQVVRILCDAGAQVRIASLDRINVDGRADHVHADLTDFPRCRSLVEGMEYVFHLAGVKGSIEVTQQRPASFFVPLLMMNTNVLEAARLAGVPRVLYTSSIGAYPSAEVFTEGDALRGEPMDTFPGWAKRMAELQIETYRIQYGLDNFAVIRPCNVYGPGDNFDPANAMVIPSLMARVRRGEDPLRVWGDGTAVRDFAYSADVAAGAILAAFYGTGGRCVNLGSGRGYSVRELVETLQRVVPFRYEFDPTKGAGYPLRVMDISLAERTLGYRPQTSLEDGLRETWDWYVAHEAEHEQKLNYFR